MDRLRSISKERREDLKQEKEREDRNGFRKMFRTTGGDRNEGLFSDSLGEKEK